MGDELVEEKELKEDFHEKAIGHPHATPCKPGTLQHRAANAEGTSLRSPPNRVPERPTPRYQCLESWVAVQRRELGVDTKERPRMGPAVEYAIPFKDWSGAQAPELFGRRFHQNFDFQLWVLHVWVHRDNPSGMFEDWNPKVSCTYAPRS